MLVGGFEPYVSNWKAGGQCFGGVIKNTKHWLYFCSICDFNVYLKIW